MNTLTPWSFQAMRSTREPASDVVGPVIGGEPLNPLERIELGQKIRAQRPDMSQKEIDAILDSYNDPNPPAWLTPEEVGDIDTTLEGYDHVQAMRQSRAIQELQNDTGNLSDHDVMRMMADKLTGGSYQEEETVEASPNPWQLPKIPPKTDSEGRPYDIVVEEDMPTPDGLRVINYIGQRYR